MNDTVQSFEDTLDKIKISGGLIQLTGLQEWRKGLQAINNFTDDKTNDNVKQLWREDIFFPEPMYYVTMHYWNVKIEWGERITVEEKYDCQMKKKKKKMDVNLDLALISALV